MPETIKANEQNLNSVFSDDYIFEIPVYQRPYAWDTEQVNDLLDDLLYAMRREGDEPYFLGSVVLIKGDDADSQVVDGQQRLTTLTMLLCVLRDLSHGQIKTDLDRYIRQQGSVIAGTSEVVRFSLRDLDRDFFYTHVQKSGGVVALAENPPHTGRRTARTAFSRMLSTYTKRSRSLMMKNAPSWLRTLFSIVISSSSLLQI